MLVVFEDKHGKTFIIKDGIKKKSKLSLLKIIDNQLKKNSNNNDHPGFVAETAKLHEPSSYIWSKSKFNY